MNRIKTDMIHLVSINVFKSNINTTEAYLENPVEPKEIRVGYSQESGFSFEDKAIRVRLDIQLEGLDNNDKELGLKGEYGIEFFFEVDNFEEFIEKNDEEKHTDGVNDEADSMVSGVLGGTLMGIVYSTARGMILERTQGTSFKGVILPVINPNDLI